MAGSLNGVETSDRADYKELANELFKLVMGTGAEKFNLADMK